MAKGTGIGALAVQISADVSDFVHQLDVADKAVGKFTGQLDKRLLDPLAKVTGAAAAAGAAVFAFTKSATDLVDELGKLSQRVGVGIEALSGLKYAAELSDVSIESLGQGLKQLSKFMVENKIEGVSVEEQLLKIAEEFGRTNDGAVKTAAAMKYFGKAGADLIPFLNQGRDGIEELRKEAAALGVVFDKEASRKAEEFNDNITRLKAAASALHVELAGPLVDALNKSAQAMLDARKSGESLIDTLTEGFRRLTTGDDAHKWNVEFTEAVDRLGAAQNNVDRLSRLGGSAAAMGLRKAKEELLQAEAEVKRLLAIKPILAPEKENKPEAERSGDPTMPTDPDKVAADQERIGKLLQEGQEEQIKVQMEAYAAIAEMRAAELEREKAFEAARLQVVFDSIDAEMAAYEEKLRTEAAIQDEIDAREDRMRQERLGQAKTFFGNVALLMQTNSKKMFEIGKQAAIAETVINTYKAAMGAYSALASIPYVGPFLGAAAAAAAVVYGMAQVNQIRSQTFQGGGSAAAPVAASSPTTGQPIGTPGGNVGASGGGQTQRIFNINITGSGRAVMEELARELNALGDEGFVFRLNGAGAS